MCSALLLPHADPKKQAEGCPCLAPHTNSASSICPDRASTLTGASGTVMSQAEGTHCPWSAQGEVQLQCWIPSTGLTPTSALIFTPILFSALAVALQPF